MRLALRASLRLFNFIPDKFVIGKACICGDDGAFLIDVFRNPQLLKTGFDRFQYGLQSVVFLAFAQGLGINNDLMLLIHRGHAVIALNRPFAGGHLGTFVIGDVTLHFLALLSLAHPWAVRLEKAIHFVHGGI